jgi:ariadne-1
MEDDDDFKVQPTKDKKKSYEIEYDCLEPEAVQSTIHTESQRTMEMLSVDVSIVEN